MIFKKTFCIIFLFFLCIAVDAQTTSFATNYAIWTRLGGNNFQQTTDHGYIVSTAAPHSMDSISDRIKGYLIKMNNAGNTQWIKEYVMSDPGVVRPQGNCSVFQCSDSGYIVASTYLKEFDFKPYLIRTDLNGNLLWAKQYPLYYGVSSCVQQTKDGGYILVGVYSSAISGTVRAFLLKTDMNGNVIFCKDLVAGTYPEGDANAVRQSADGGFIICGGYNGHVGSYIVKTDSLGVLQWQNYYSTGIEIQDVRESSSGDIIACGNVNPGSSSKLCILKLDGGGNLLWQKFYSSPDVMAGIYGSSLKETAANNIIVAVAEWPYVLHSQLHSYLLLLDDTGNFIWTKKYDDSWITTVECTNDNSYAICSQTSSYATIPSSGDYLSVIKIDSLDEHSCPHIPVAIQPDTFSLIASYPFTLEDLTIVPIDVVPVLSDKVVSENNNCYYSDTTATVDTSGVPTTIVDTSGVTCSNLLFIPNVFTPNNDNNNDLLKIEIPECIDSFDMKIYSRWGGLAFSTTDRTVFWNGKTEGIDASAGAYYYVLSIKNKKIKGFLTLLR